MLATPSTNTPSPTPDWTLALPSVAPSLGALQAARALVGASRAVALYAASSWRTGLPAGIGEAACREALRTNPCLVFAHPLIPPPSASLVALAGDASKCPGPDGRPLLAVLVDPAAAGSLEAQIDAALGAWTGWIPSVSVDALLRARDVLTEQHRMRGPGPGPVEAPRFEAPPPPPPSFLSDAPPPPAATDESEAAARFTIDRDWMPSLVLIAKQTFVWLHQLSEAHGRPISTLDAIPDEELAALAERGVTGLWLIGLWERSTASAAIKQRMGNPEALASAYSLDDYVIARGLGGEQALDRLRERAWAHGIRLAADMVPNHVGVDGRWVVERPELFVQLDHPPYDYRFTGPDLCAAPDVEIRLEDGYWDRSDAAVVFQRRDARTGDVRYLYHGNDGTSMPWNDTAQLDYLNPAVRELVIATIVDVARRFPVIRFDAAMTLARRHVRRLWHPAPGDGGAIPSRSRYAADQAAFDAAMPREFWREVVERVQQECPDTLLLAEAFWMMEGYFVRTLGMHRVYNSAFMHMLRDEDNAGFRRLLREVLAYDPAVLQRFVNFMNNPDEDSAASQFGRGDKYFGVATLLATLPGLPMLGHGQFEGYEEKYGMEYARAYRDEPVDVGLRGHHDRVIVPLLRRREDFSGAERFAMYDLEADDGTLEEGVIAYSNVGLDGARTLVVFNNQYETVAGRLVRPFPEAAADVACVGRRFELPGYAYRVFIDGEPAY